MCGTLSELRAFCEHCAATVTPEVHWIISLIKHYVGLWPTVSPVSVPSEWNRAGFQDQCSCTTMVDWDYLQIGHAFFALHKTWPKRCVS